MQYSENKGVGLSSSHPSRDGAQKEGSLNNEKEDGELPALNKGQTRSKINVPMA
jgi:hypothetical protein